MEAICTCGFRRLAQSDGPSFTRLARGKTESLALGLLQPSHWRKPARRPRQPASCWSMASTPNPKSERKRPGGATPSYMVSKPRGERMCFMLQSIKAQEERPCPDRSFVYHPYVVAAPVSTDKRGPSFSVQDVRKANRYAGLGRQGSGFGHGQGGNAIGQSD